MCAAKLREGDPSFAVQKNLDKGEYLFHEGDRSEGFYIVQKGAINVHRVSAAGKEQVIHIFLPIESFAEATLATEGGYPADARATEVTTVLLVPKMNLSISCASAPISRCACSVR